MTHVKAYEGRVAHHFHGSYWAEIALAFSSLSESLDAAIQLRREGFKLRRANNPTIVIVETDSDGIADFERRHPPVIAPCGHPACDPSRGARGRKRKAPEGAPHPTSWPCQAESIGAITHSIDWGPKFAVVIETDAPHEQTSLHGAWLRALHNEGIGE